MIKTIYILIQSSGSWSDYSTKNLISFEDEDTALYYEDLFESGRQVFKNLCKEELIFVVDWEEKNPRPKLTPYPHERKKANDHRRKANLIDDFEEKYEKPWLKINAIEQPTYNHWTSMRETARLNFKKEYILKNLDKDLRELMDLCQEYSIGEENYSVEEINIFSK